MSVKDPAVSRDAPTSVRTWLDGRLAGVPIELAEAVRRLVGEASRGGVVDLADAALWGLEGVAALADEGGALELLAADALLTYAFEAAADPELGGDAHAAILLADRIGPRGTIGARVNA